MLRHVALTVSLLLAGSSVTSLAKTAAPRAIDQAPGAAAPVAAAPVSCEARIDELHLDAPSARFERYVDALPELVVETRVGHALYLDWPVNESPARARLEAARRPDRLLREIVASGDRARLREVALSEGYLFADRPALARALSASVHLEDLFDAPVVFRQRDGAIDRLTRDDEGGYLDADGTRATLRLNDRVAVDEADLAAPRHLDLEVIRRRTGALRTIPVALGHDAAALDLVFPDGTRRPALARLDGATEVSCVGGDLETLEATLGHAARFAARQDRLALAARALVRESPRFDEPIDEPEGVQEDGRLREAWVAAYGRGERTFHYRDHDYPVFDADGNARPPQVCVDFVFDSWERGEGTWYRPRGEAPGVTEGQARFRGVPRRSVQQLLEHASTDATFERLDVASRDRVALQEGPRFARAMARIADDVRPGDALVIHGLRLQDGRNHYHAVLVLEVEPITGVPMTVADNQGRPHLRTLGSAMRAAPLRSIKHRIRVDFDALEAA
ncbi:MAG: hypothetical protein H6719_29610 [Sandaracinaceae bacterium]|nr:hypothetical protein [Sandaracinaceae bacterium]